MPIRTIRDKIAENDDVDIPFREYVMKGVVLLFKTESEKIFRLNICSKSYVTVQDLLEKGMMTKENIMYMHATTSGLNE